MVNNLIKQFARVYEIVKCYGPWATLKIIDCPLLSISQWNGSKGHENSYQFKDERSLLLPIQTSKLCARLFYQKKVQTRQV